MKRSVFSLLSLFAATTGLLCISFSSVAQPGQQQVRRSVPISRLAGTDRVRVSKTYKLTDYNRSGNLASSFIKKGAPLYELNGHWFNKPLVITQWLENDSDEELMSKNSIDHEFFEFGDGKVYISQSAPYVWAALDCRLFDRYTQKLIKPTQCIRSGAMHTSIVPLGNNLFQVWAGQEGGGWFMISRYTDEGKQTDLLNLDLGGQKQIKINSFKHGVLDFHSNCDYKVGCERMIKDNDNLKYHFQWNEQSGLVKMN